MTLQQIETIAAIAMHCAGPRTVRGVRYSLSAYTVAATIARMARIARTLHRRYEIACNEDIAREPYGLCPACGGPNRRYRMHGAGGNDGARKHVPSQCWEAKTEKLEARVVAIAAELGMVATTQRDPRGPAVRLWADREDGKAIGVLS